MKKPARRRGPSRPKRRAAKIAIKRAYDKPSPQDGVRILIDRLWPRGLTKTKLKVAAWPRALTPSTALRKWYGHEPERFAEFRRRCHAELAEHAGALAALRAMVRGRAATLVTATREIDLSHAVVLRELLSRKTIKFLQKPNLGTVAAPKQHVRSSSRNRSPIY